MSMKIARAVVVRPTYRPGEIALRASSNPSLNIRKALASAGSTVGDEVTIILSRDFNRMTGALNIYETTNEDRTVTTWWKAPQLEPGVLTPGTYELMRSAVSAAETKEDVAAEIDGEPV